MPRGKYVNHKGRTRQFTPAEILQMEPERLRQDEDKKIPVRSHPKTDSDDKFFRNRGVHSLIEISNPNRMPREKHKSLLITMAGQEQLSPDDDEGEMKRRNERKRERMQYENMQKSKETVADLARLAIIRQEREAAAQRRLAAKKAAAESASSSSTSSLKKIIPKSGEQMEDSQSEDLVRSSRLQRKPRSSRKK
ncbi:28 kDa heat- and acid-stable phosphoprotein-like [Drosophila eugracilis]|uniref:28 kDa heat- and acid-stable phosphoprotein-like n=1 Tax=Drosophila eugracilis TaxID=29029 RepID=UPI0007E738F2|nr:28 kDa heat- and acid-stable phosphoprotein-like [Drosophila eugracilis]XP_017067608.1 28 kDa heat- and acid-stable phosphoprotein-like [Drosophila eugracilis]